MATWTDLTYAFGSLLTSTKMTQNQANFEAMAQGASGAPRVLGTDNFYRMSGQDSSFIVNSDTTLGSGIYQYTILEVNSGKTLTVASGGNFIFMCSSHCVVDGTIDMSGAGAAGGATSTVGSEGGSGAGGGGGNGAGAAGGNAFYFSVVECGGYAGTINSAGNNGGTNPIARTVFGNMGFNSGVSRVGAGGGGAVHIAGNGGGAIVIASPSVTINSLGIIDCSGTDGSSGGANAGAGGGGGGFIQVMTSAESYTNTGSFNVNGGTGGATTGAANEAGGDGGTGITEVIQLT